MDGSAARPLPPPAPAFISRPAAIAGCAGIAGACLYGHWQLPLARAEVLALWGMGALFAAVILVTTELRCRRAMQTWRRIADGSLEETEESLRQAVVELYALPPKILRARMQNWLIAGLVIAFALFAMDAGGGVGTTVRVLTFTVVYGPWMGLLGHYGLLRRSRALISEVAARGVPPQQVLALAPRGARPVSQQVLMLAIALLAPLLLLADAATTLAAQQGEALAQVADAAARVQQAAAMASHLRWTVAAFVGISIIGVVVVARLAGLTLEEPLRRLAQEAHALSNGKLSEPVAVLGDGEVMQLSRSLVTLQRHLGSMLGELRTAGARIGDTLTQISSTSSEYETGAAAQSSTLAQTAASTEELARSGRTIAERAEQVAEIARRTLDSAQNAQKQADAFNVSMQQMRGSNAAINHAVNELNSRVGQIGRIAEFIHSVADKSDVLALNAELEGVKAGEVGTAFSLVATEMRRMAENVTRSTQEIEQVIDQVRDATRGAVAAVDGGVKMTERGSELMSEVSSQLSNILGLAQQTMEAVEQITHSIQQQQSGTDQLAEAMVSLMGVTQQTQNATQTVLTANAALARVSTNLKATVEKFEL